MSGRRPSPGDIVQLDPDKHEVGRFGACLMVVTEDKGWGVVGYVKNAGSSGVAFYRAEDGTYEVVGRAPWTLEAALVEEPVGDSVDTPDKGG